MYSGRRSEHVDRSGLFVSQKSSKLAIPVRHHLLRDALAQAALDAAVRSIEYVGSVRTASTTVKVDAIAIESDDGRRYLDVIEARPRRSMAQQLIVAQILCELGLRPWVLEEADILSEPRCTNVRTVWAHVDHPVAFGLRMQVLGALTDDGTMPLAELLSRLRCDRDPAPGVMALACLNLIELDLTSAPLGPATIVRLRA
jgi:hypothetical protein